MSGRAAVSALLFIFGGPFAIPSPRTDEDLVVIQHTVKGLSQAALARFVARARKAVQLSGTVSLLVTGNHEMRGLNRRFRGKNKATDVLSFPAMPEVRKKFAGDVAISAELAVQNAERLGHTAADEIKILALHGVLHLAGYDHECDDGQMERREQRLRKMLGLRVGLIERTNHSTPRSSRRSARISQ